MKKPKGAKAEITLNISGTEIKPIACYMDAQHRIWIAVRRIKPGVFQGVRVNRDRTPSKAIFTMAGLAKEGATELTIEQMETYFMPPRA